MIYPQKDVPSSLRSQSLQTAITFKQIGLCDLITPLSLISWKGGMCFQSSYMTFPASILGLEPSLQFIAHCSLNQVILL